MPSGYLHHQITAQDHLWLADQFHGSTPTDNAHENRTLCETNYLAFCSFVRMLIADSHDEIVQATACMGDNYASCKIDLTQVYPF